MWCYWRLFSGFMVNLVISGFLWFLWLSIVFCSSFCDYCGYQWLSLILHGFQWLSADIAWLVWLSHGYHMVISGFAWLSHGYQWLLP